jgi:hypothetical protein
MVDTPGSLGAILTQVDKDRMFSFASRQLKDHKKNYSPFLLKAAAAVWGMDFLLIYAGPCHFGFFANGTKCSNHTKSSI